MDLKLIQRLNGHILSRLGLDLERTRPSRRELEDVDHTDSSPIEEIGEVRYRSMDWTYTAPIEKLVGRPIFGYGQQSWHPLVAACRELLESIDAPYETSALRRFYRTFTPATIAEAHRLENPGPLDRVPATSRFEPWMLLAPPNDDPFTPYGQSGTPVFGPVSHEEGRAEWRRLRGSLTSILEYGYRPSLFPRGRINVTILRSRGDERYVVDHGQHRAAVLAAMGHNRVEVGIHQRGVRLVDEDEVARWPHVQSGFVSEEVALGALRRYFATPETDPAIEIATNVRG